jgi:hypothetical protein
VAPSVVPDARTIESLNDSFDGQCDTRNTSQRARGHNGPPPRDEGERTVLPGLGCTRRRVCRPRAVSRTPPHVALSSSGHQAWVEPRLRRGKWTVDLEHNLSTGPPKGGRWTDPGGPHGCSVYPVSGTDPRHPVYSDRMRRRESSEAAKRPTTVGVGQGGVDERLRVAHDSLPSGRMGR